MLVARDRSSGRGAKVSVQFGFRIGSHGFFSSGVRSKGTASEARSVASSRQKPSTITSGGQSYSASGY